MFSENFQWRFPIIFFNISGVGHLWAISKGHALRSSVTFPFSFGSALKWSIHRYIVSTASSSLFQIRGNYHFIMTFSSDDRPFWRFLKTLSFCQQTYSISVKENISMVFCWHQVLHCNIRHCWWNPRRTWGTWKMSIMLMWSLQKHSPTVAQQKNKLHEERFFSKNEDVEWRTKRVFKTKNHFWCWCKIFIQWIFLDMRLSINNSLSHALHHIVSSFSSVIDSNV